MKTGRDALVTAENDSRRAKHENGTRRPRYRRKRVRVRKTRNQDPTPSVPTKMSTGAQNRKTGHNAFGTAENEFGSAEQENGTRCARYRRKQVRTRAIRENGTRRPLYRRKRVRRRKTRKQEPTPSVPSKTNPDVQNMKTGPDALGAVKKESGRAKHENGTRRPRYHRKLLRARKT
jgi:hypothetical protein